jgi:hypothetical protein
MSAGFSAGSSSREQHSAEAESVEKQRKRTGASRPQIINKPLLFERRAGILK